MGAATPRQPGRSVKDQVSSYDTSSSYTDSSEPLPPLLARAAESDPRLTRLDLCFNKQFMVLSGQQKLQALEQLALGKALESVRLDGLGLDNTHGATLARLLRHDGNNDGGVRTLSLQSNSLGEPALLALAKAVSGHPSISELAVCHRGLEPQSSRPQTLQVCCSQVCASPGQVGNQRDAMSTLAVSTLLDAMAAAPRLTKLKLGPVRDEVQRRRHQLLTMEAVERARRERAGSPELKRRANSPELKRRENSPDIKRRAAAAASKRLSAQMKERASPIPRYLLWLYLLWLAMLAMAVPIRLAILAMAGYACYGCTCYGCTCSGYSRNRSAPPPYRA
jgi:hypothetical protein